MSYSVIWKYKVKPDHVKTFEQEYGSKGTWCRLFNKSKDYTGSFLHKNMEENNTYVLIDTWTNKESYDGFKDIHSEIYNELSRKFEIIYESEEKIGEFNQVE